MNYYWFNRQEMLQKAKKNYSKEKAAKYYKQNKEESVMKTCHKKKKTRLKRIKKKISINYQYQYQLVQYKKNNYFLFFT